MISPLEARFHVGKLKLFCCAENIMQYTIHFRDVKLDLIAVVSVTSTLRQIVQKNDKQKGPQNTDKPDFVLKLFEIFSCLNCESFAFFDSTTITLVNDFTEILF